MTQQPASGVSLGLAALDAGNPHAWEVQPHAEPLRLVSGREIVVTVRRHALGLALWTIFLLLLAGIYLFFATPEFVATTQVVLQPRRVVGTATDTIASALVPTLDSAQADSEVAVVQSERNLRYVFDALDIEHDAVLANEPPGLMGRLLDLVPSFRDPDQLAPAERASAARARAFEAFSNRVAVKRLGQSYVLEISFFAPSPDEAARLANAVTASYMLGQIEFRAATAARGTEFLQERIAGLEAEQRSAADAVKSGQIPSIPFANADARVVGAAVPPLYKTTPKSKLILLLAAVVAMASGIGVIVIRQSVDRKIRSRLQFNRMIGFDCIGALPRISVWRGRSSRAQETATRVVVDAPRSSFAQSMRVLRTVLQARLPQGVRMAIGVTAVSPREGASTVASNLARLLAANGPVVLVDGNLHNPSLTRALAPTAIAGMSDVLGSHAARSSLPTVRVDADLDFVPASSSKGTLEPNLFIGSAAMQAALTEARLRGDVVIDLGAMSQSPDAQAIGPALDGVLLCVEANRTTVDDVSEALTALRSAQVRVLGVVLNKLPPTAPSPHHPRAGLTGSERWKRSGMGSLVAGAGGDRSKAV